MDRITYQEAVRKAYNHGAVKHPLQRTQIALQEQFGTDLEPPQGYDGETIFDAYMTGYNN
jgi:hypothetical protein